MTVPRSVRRRILARDDFVAMVSAAAAQQRLAGHSGPVSVPIADKLTLTPAEAAALSGLSRGAIDSAIKAGALTAHRGPWRGRRIRRTDVERWVAGL